MPESSKFKRSLKRLGLFLVVIIGLLVLITRSFVLTKLVLPVLSDAIGMQIEAERIHLGPRSFQIEELDVSGGLKFDHLRVSGVSLSPDWSDLFSGTLAFSSVIVTEPFLTVQVPGPRLEDPPEDLTEKEAAPKIRLQNLAIQNGSVKILSAENSIQFSDLHVNIPRVTANTPVEIQAATRFSSTSLKTESANQSGRLETNVILPLNSDFQPIGAAGTLKLNLEESSPDIPSMTLSLEVDTTFASKERSIEIRAGSATLLSQNDIILEARIREPFQAELDGGLLNVSDTSIFLDIKETKIRQLPFSALLPLSSGTVRGQIDVLVQDNATNMDLHVDLALEALSGHINGVHLDDTSIQLNVKAAGSKDSLIAETLGARISHGKDTVFNFRGKGLMKVETLSGELEIQELEIDAAGVQSLSPILPELHGTFTSNGILIRDEEGAMRFRLSSSLLSGRFQNFGDFPSPLQITTVGEFADKLFTIRTAQLSWPSPLGGREGLNVKGSLNAGTPDAPEIDLDLEAGRLHLDPWLAALPSKEKSNAQASPSSVGTPFSEPIAPLPLGPSSLTMDIEEISVKNLQISEIDIHTALGPTSVVLHPWSFKINGSDIETSSSTDWKDGTPQFDVDVRLVDLDLEPVFNTIFPETPGAIKGMFSLSTSLTGTGLKYASLAPTLEGNLEASIVEGKIRLFAPVADAPKGLLQTQKLLESIIRALATALQVPPEDLLAPPVEQLSLDATIKERLLTVNSFSAENPEFRLQATGHIPLDPSRPGASALGKIPVSLGLSTNLAKRVRIYREDRLQDEKIMLPPLLDIQGTLAQPEIDVRKRVLTGLIITGVNERNEIGNENVQRALNILGGILSGEGPAPTPTPVPSPSP